MLTSLSRTLVSRISRRPARGWIGIDIGASSVKVAQVECREGQYRIAKGLLLKDAKPGEGDSAVLQNDWLRRALNVLTFPESGFAGHQAACVLSMSNTELRTLDLPPASDHEIRQILSQELDSGSEGQAEPREFDYWRSSASESQVGILSISHGLADSVARLSRGAGLECRVLDGVPFTLARALQMVSAPHSESGPEAILDWGHAGATFNVAVGGQPLFTRCYRGCGMQQIVQAMESQLGYDAEECEQLLAEQGLPGAQISQSGLGDLQRLIGELSSEVVDQVVEETLKTLAFLRTQPANLQPTRLWLAGGGALIKNIGSLIETRTHIPVASWQLPFASDEEAVASHSPPAALLTHAAALSMLAWEL